MRGWRNCVGVRTRLLPDAAAMPGWEEMTSGIGRERERGERREEQKGTGEERGGEDGYRAQPSSTLNT